MIVGADCISKRRKPPLYSLNIDGIGEGSAEMVKFLIGRGVGDEQTFAVTTESMTISFHPAILV